MAIEDGQTGGAVAGSRQSRRGAGVRWTMVNPPTEREKVLFGKHGWLFLQRDTNDVIGQHAGRVRLGRERRRTW